jgi:hypothetical protein
MYAAPQQRVKGGGNASPADETFVLCEAAGTRRLKGKGEFA